MSTNSESSFPKYIVDFALLELVLYPTGLLVPPRLHKIRPNGRPLKEAAYTLAAMMSKAGGKWFRYNAKHFTEQTGFTSHKLSLHISLLLRLGIIEKKRENKVHGRTVIRVRMNEVFRLACISLMEEEDNEDHR